MDILVTIKVSVDDQREADLIGEAVFSGYAEQVLKVGILYGNAAVPFAGIAAQQPPDNTKAKEAEMNIQLKRQAPVNLEIKQVKTEPEVRKPGLGGIKKLRRERG